LRPFRVAPLVGQTGLPGFVDRHALLASHHPEHRIQPETHAMTLTRFSFPTPIHFGAGARKAVATHLLERGIRRPLIVTDRALAKLPVLAEFRTHLDGLDVAVYDGVHGNPVASQVMSGAAAFQAHAADAVIGFGGGAALDVAKVVALMAVHEGDVIEYAWDHPQVRPIVNPLPYLVALPTTSGTGSEVGRSSVVGEEDTHVKRAVFSPRLLPQAVFADPELTFALPGPVTAATGMDALTHNIESYLSPAYHPLCDGIALEGLRIGARALATAVHEPKHLQARADMMMSSMMGAIAFQKDLGSVHACAHALGAVNDLHHGLANALMIDTVLAWNFEAVPAKFDELAHAAGVAGGGAAFVPWLKALKARIGIEGGLAARGVTEAHLPRLVALAEKDFAGGTNPRPALAADYERLLRAAM
jgi:alcohol dehydrogenase class IV